MDGVLVAYHNTARIFGFQYIPLEEMEYRLYGVANRGAAVFGRCLRLLEHILEEAVLCYPEQVRAAIGLLDPHLSNSLVYQVLRGKAQHCPEVDCLGFSCGLGRGKARPTARFPA